MALAAAYPVGTPGQKWEAREREQWRALVEAPSRAYSEEVLDPRPLNLQTAKC